MMSRPLQTDTHNLATDLRAAMRTFGQSVVIISTADSEGRHYAMTATAVTPVSMDPPSMLICVNRSASFYRILDSGAHFCLNILNRDQADVARSCAAASGEERFSVGQWDSTAIGIPYLADAQAAILCHQRQSLTYGSHDIFIGDVQSVTVSKNADPLLYLDGAYRRVGPEV